jgi:hypothetical protein
LSTAAFATLLPVCLSALPPFIRGYLHEGQPEPPWGGLTLAGLRDLTALGAISTLAVVILVMATSRVARRQVPVN